MRYRYHMNQNAGIAVASGSYACDLSAAGWIQFFGAMDTTASISSHHQMFFDMITNITSITNQFGFNGARTSNEAGPGDQWVWLTLSSSGQTYYSGSGADGPRDGVEYFYEIKWTGSSYTAYRDGSQIITFSSYSNGYDIGSNQTLSFGTFAGFSSGTLKGWVRDFRIYSGTHPTNGTLLHHWPIDDNVSNGGEITDIVGGAHGVLTAGAGSAWEQFSQPYSYGRIITPR